MEAYLDNSATTRCSERAKNKMVQILTEDYGNPSSLHNMGKTAEDYIKEAKEQIAKTLRCDEKEIVFTSGGTESNNMALIGGALANKRQGKHIITTSIEHASVQAPLAYLKELGYEITELSVDHDGIISQETSQKRKSANWPDGYATTCNCPTGGKRNLKNPTLTSLSPCATRCSHGSRRKSSMNLSASLIRNLPDVLREKLSFPLGQDGQL